MPKPKVIQEDVAYLAIIRMILENQVRPGDCLLETTISENLGLSRTPVSHALGRLLAEGFLEKRSKRGYLIPFPSPEDARHVFSVRQILEGQAAAEAAKAIRPEDFPCLDRYHHECEESIRRGDKEWFSTANENFHIGIARFSGNPYLERFVRLIFWRSNIYIFFFDGFYFHPGNAIPYQKTPEQHQGIVDAIMAKNAVLANRLMQEHILHTFNSMLPVLRG